MHKIYFCLLTLRCIRVHKESHKRKMSGVVEKRQQQQHTSAWGAHLVKHVIFETVGRSGWFCTACNEFQSENKPPPHTIFDRHCCEVSDAKLTQEYENHFGIKEPNMQDLAEFEERCIALHIDIYDRWVCDGSAFQYKRTPGKILHQASV